ncbi:hypothetical protein G6F70_008022 [Rhizopus microsporus]|nr:hypothetical protein G6F71_008015 [Rhizopus microsporus]KAG1195712.1 hypothetical protein G6F70_008022 [Rhizopus microsporus]KAG1207545.1 hypothetical protein G6F69_007954 [Rhizopus microsporus]KAG1228361.1 hypothetical protein G6F67_007874 [Rhizopus microsporus]KAG1260737.1 hypothetical protein G6F68_007208 [Rhizopus microsporus]
MDNIDQLVKQVLIVDDSKDPASIRRDLEYTQNVEATLNRIFDGEFLKGIKDNKPNDTLIILDSDEEDTYQAESRNNAAVKDVSTDIFDINTVFSDPVVKTPNKPSKRKFMDPFDDFDDIPVPSSSKKKPTRTPDSNSSFLKKAGQSSKGPFDLFNSQEDKGETDRKKKGKERGSMDNFFLEEELQPVSEDEELFFLKEIDSTITSSINKSTELIAFSDDEEDILVKKATERPPKDKSKEDTLLLKEIDDEESFTFAEHEGPESVNEEKDNTLSREDVSKRSTSTSIFDIEEEEDILHVPTQDEFFDELLSLKKDKVVIDIDSFEEDESDEKRKRRQYDDQYKESNDDRYALLSFEEPSSSQDRSALTAKEKKKLEAEERKRKRQKAAEEKKRLKELKQKEKERQALFEKENRNKTDRTAILKEMILDTHPDFLLTDAGKLLEASLTPKMAEIRPLSEHSELRYTISWKRKCQAEWHSESQTFIPLRNMKIIQEPYVLIYMPIDELNEHIRSETIFDHMEQAQSSAKDRQILLLVEGLEAYYKKRALIQRRHFQNQVRQSIEGPSNDNPSSRKRKSGQENLESLPSRETVEQYLNELQIVKNIMVVPTKNSEDTVVWIENLTIDLGLGRYKTKDLNSTYKGGKSGANETDTYFKMLQEIQLCTPAIAKSIMKAYPTLQSLHQSYRELDKPSGEMMLADLEVERSAIRARDRNRRS